MRCSHSPLLSAQSNVDRLEAEFWRISDPSHSNYRRFMTREQIADAIAPAASDHDAVVDWLVAGGVPRAQIRSHRDSLHVLLPLPAAAKLFQTQFRKFSHAQYGAVWRQLGAYSVPSRLARSIAFVEGLSNFPHQRHKPLPATPPAAPTVLRGAASKDLAAAAATKAAVVPQTIHALYSLPVNESVSDSALLTAAGAAGSVKSNQSLSQGVVEFEACRSLLLALPSVTVTHPLPCLVVARCQWEFFSPDDLDWYSILTNVTLPEVEEDHIVGGNDPKRPGSEATLDIQVGTSPRLSGRVCVVLCCLHLLPLDLGFLTCWIACANRVALLPWCALRLAADDVDAPRGRDLVLARRHEQLDVQVRQRLLRRRGTASICINPSSKHNACSPWPLTPTPCLCCVLDVQDVPLVISISYGTAESDQCDTDKDVRSLARSFPCVGLAPLACPSRHLDSISSCLPGLLLKPSPLWFHCSGVQLAGHRRGAVRGPRECGADEDRPARRVRPRRQRWESASFPYCVVLRSPGSFVSHG